MKVNDFIKKCLFGGKWFVGYKEINSENNKYTIIPMEEGWIADPFLFEYQGKHFLFVEYVKHDKGEIAYFEFIDGKPVFQKVIISEPYHLSYPCVFCYENQIYMIPESADNKSVDLYKAIEFPDKWEKTCQLMQGVFYDTTYVQYKGNDYLFSYSPNIGANILKIYAFDIEKKKTIQIAEKKYSKNVGRPAGRCINENNNQFRPAQDCERKYGENLLIYRIQNINQGRYEETLEKRISTQDIELPYQRIHTYNRDNIYETIDVFTEQLQPFRVIGLIRKKIKQHSFHK